MPNRPFARRTVTAKFRGRESKLSIDPNEFSCGTLASELADLWVRQCEFASYTTHTATGYYGAVRNFCEYVSTLPNAEAASLFDESVDVALAIFTWTPLRATAETRRRYQDEIIRLVRRAIMERRPVPQRLIGVATAHAHGRAKSGPSGAPLDEYSNAERVRMISAAKRDIGRAEERLRRAAELLRKSPEISRLLHSAMTGRTRGAALRTELLNQPELLSLLGEVGGAAQNLTGSSSHYDYLRALGSLVGLDRHELMSYLVMLGWSTGLAPDQLRFILLTDLEFSSTGVRFKATKLRAHEESFKEYKYATKPNEWNSACLLRRAVAATDFARSFSEGNELWLGPNFVSSSLRVSHWTSKVSLSDWLAKHEIEATLPHDARRIRKAHKAIRAGISGSAQTAAENDHTVATFNRHYSGTATLTSLSARIINKAQNKIFDLTIGKSPWVVTASAAEVKQSASSTAEAVRIASQVMKDSPIDRALAASACLDPTDSPFSTKGMLCLQRPLSCLFCRNSVTFLDHLPQLILLRGELEAHGKEMPPSEFVSSFGPYLDRIDEILSLFSPQSLADAELHVQSARAGLFLALNHKSVLS